MKVLIQSIVRTKLSSRWNDKMVEMALQAVLMVHPSDSHMTKVDIKRYAKVEKIPGGEISDCTVLKGVMFSKDTTHSKMCHHIENPCILLLDLPLEYKKGESQTNVEITDKEDWNTILKMEEEYIKNMCMEIIVHKPDIVIMEKGVSDDLAQHYLQMANITAFRHLRKMDNNRIARAMGRATIVSCTEEIQESDIGTKCGLFEMRKIGEEEWFCFLEECEDPKACTIVLRGGSKDVLNEIECNLQDAMQVVHNVVYNPKLLPGGGATEMAVAVGLRHAGQKIQGMQQGPFCAVGDAMEVIPCTLVQNCGVSVIHAVTALCAKHAAAYDANPDGQCHWGINGITGKHVDMEELGIWELFSVKMQTIKTAIESSTCMIL